MLEKLKQCVITRLLCVSFYIQVYLGTLYPLKIFITYLVPSTLISTLVLICTRVYCKIENTLCKFYQVIIILVTQLLPQHD